MLTRLRFCWAEGGAAGGAEEGAEEGAGFKKRMQMHANNKIMQKNSAERGAAGGAEDGVGFKKRMQMHENNKHQSKIYIFILYPYQVMRYIYTRLLFLVFIAPPKNLSWPCPFNH